MILFLIKYIFLTHIVGLFIINFLLNFHHSCMHVYIKPQYPHVYVVYVLMFQTTLSISIY